MPRTNDSSATCTPLSPSTTSSRIAHVWGPTAAFAASRSLNWTVLKPVSIGPNGFWNFSWPVAAIVAIVRPWNEPVNVTISYAPLSRSLPHLRASLMIVSFASAPEFTKNTRSPTVFSTSSSASSSCGVE